MIDFIKENSYNMVKMFVDQIAMTIFGTIMAIATSRSNTMLLIASIFSILFYLVVLYTVGWEIGAKDKIKLDGGRMRPFPTKGLFIALGANVPNLLLALLMGFGIAVGTEWGGNISVVCNAIARLFEGMYLGVIKVLEDTIFVDARIADVWWWFIMITIPAILVGWFSYYMGSHEKRISAFFGIKVKPNNTKN
ncbi:MAG: hypothetical protein HFE63_06655 [Clostridiales bacterium]|nr:hypothetical protein [Clostridiales bacterium]